VKKQIEVSNVEVFEDAFGNVGRKVRPRADGRTHEEKEWYVLRRFLKCALSRGYFKCPLRIEKAEPPDPDFHIDSDGTAMWVEIIEATFNADQEEMNEIERSESEIIMSGEFGGRYADGVFGDRAERDWAADILRAIRRKRTKSVFAYRMPLSHLVVFVNSNPGSVVDECEAFATLYESFGRVGASVRRIVNGALVHVVSRARVCIDVLDSRVIVEREREPYRFPG
jgi:hypothetical protein